MLGMTLLIETKLKLNHGMNIASATQLSKRHQAQKVGHELPSQPETIEPTRTRMTGFPFLCTLCTRTEEHRRSVEKSHIQRGTYRTEKEADAQSKIEYTRK